MLGTNIWFQLDAHPFLGMESLSKPFALLHVSLRLPPEIPTIYVGCFSVTNNQDSYSEYYLHLKYLGALTGPSTGGLDGMMDANVFVIGCILSASTSEIENVFYNNNILYMHTRGQEMSQ